jgi:hypothetical protein
LGGFEAVPRPSVSVRRNSSTYYGRMEMTQTRKVQIMATIGITMACLAATYAAWVGYSTSTNDRILSSGAAITCGLLVFIVCEAMVMMLPRLDNKARLITAGAALVLMIMTFNFSTLWGVMALGGKSAMNYHIQQTLVRADETALKLQSNGDSEDNLAPQLRGLATQFDNLATREATGAFTGMRGEGDVVSSLRNTSGMFSTTAKTIEDVGAKRKDLNDEYQRLSSEARKIGSEFQGTDVTDGAKIRELSAKFGDKLSAINSVFVQMRSTSARAFLKAVNANLAQLGTAAQSNSTPAQKAVMEERVKPAVVGAQRTVSLISNTEELGQETNQIFSMIDPQEAIWTYMGRIRTAWGAAIAIDMVPFFMAFLMLAFLKPFKEDERKEETDQSSAGDRDVMHLVNRESGSRNFGDRRE